MLPASGLNKIKPLAQTLLLNHWCKQLLQKKCLTSRIFFNLTDDLLNGSQRTLCILFRAVQVKMPALYVSKWSAATHESQQYKNYVG